MLNITYPRGLHNNSEHYAKVTIAGTYGQARERALQSMCGHVLYLLVVGATNVLFESSPSSIV